MSQPTKDQWQAFKAEFNGQYGQAYLCCDGYLIAVQLQRWKNRLVHVVYVNGIINGEWWKIVDEDQEGTLPEESRRFLCPARLGRSAKEIKSYEKAYGKRECKSLSIYKKKISTRPYWNSINSFVAHVKKHNEQIEILDYDAYTARMAQLKHKESI